MTRAMFATVLYRIAGMPAVSGANSFYDVAAGQWYTDAILWGRAQASSAATATACSAQMIW